jgi:DivIVA domain-containing protein
MIDLTPLEVRKKKGDFRRTMRGYDPELVDDFLDLVADRLEQLVRDNLTLQDRVARQDDQVKDYRDRERALTEALVSAQEMREEVRRQAAREAELATRSAHQEAEQLRTQAEEEVRRLRSSAQTEASQVLASLRDERQREEEAVRRLRARQQEFLSSYRVFLEQELAELAAVARAAGASEKAANAREARSGADAGVQSGKRGGSAANPTAGPGGRSASAGTASAPQNATQPKPSPAQPEEEPFEPEPFVDDDADAVVEAWDAESAQPQVGAAPGTADRTDVAGGTDAEARLYDAIGDDADGDGIPGPIGLTEDEPWNAAPEYSLSELEVVGGENPADGIDLGDDDEEDEETTRLLRNAAAAGYRLDNEPVEELLLDDTAAAESDEPAPKDDGWLPNLLEDDK